MQKRIGKKGIKGVQKWVQLFVPLVLVLFVAQIFVPLAVTNAQLELELECNETAVDGNGNLTSLVNNTSESENTTAKAMEGDTGNELSSVASTENVNLTVADALNESLTDSITKNIEITNKTEKNKTEIKILFYQGKKIQMPAYYLTEAVKNLTLENTTIKLAVWNTDVNEKIYLHYNDTPAPDPEKEEYNFTSFDIIAIYSPYYPIQKIQEGLNEANETGRKTVHIIENPSLWEVNVDQKIGKYASKEYYKPGGIENFKRLLVYLAVELAGANETILPGIKLPRDGIFHPDYKSDLQPCHTCLFNNLSSYFEWYEEQGKYHPEKPIIGLTLSSYDYTWSYNLAVWIALIREFESRNVNVIPILDRTDMRWAFFNQTNNKTIVDMVVFNALSSHSCTIHNLSSCEERIEVKAMLGVPWIYGIRAYSQTPDEWKNSTIGLPIAFISPMVAIQELEGDIEPIVIGAKIVDEITQVSMNVPIDGSDDNRISYIVNRTLMWTNLKYMDNSEKKVAFIYYSYPPGKAEIGAANMDVPRTLEVLLNEMHGAGYYMGENFTKWDISDRNDSLSNKGSIVVKLITQGRNVGTWVQDDVDEMAKSGAVVLIPKEKYESWFNEFPEDMRQDVIKDWGQPPGNQMVYNASNGSQYIVIPNIRYGNILLAPQPYRGWLNSEKTLYHNVSLPPNHQYIAFYLWLKKEFNASALVHVGTHGTLEWLPGKQVGLDRKSWPEALIQDFPNPYIYIVDNVGEGTQAKRRSYSVIIDHMAPPFIPAGLYGNYSNLHQTIHHYLLAKENGNTLLMEKYMNTSIGIIKDTHIDEDTGINISCGASFSEFEDLVIYGKVHDYLHEIMYTYMPYGMRIFANPIPNESAVTLVRGMLDDSFVEHIQAINASCDFHDTPNYNETCSYKILWDYLINNGSNSNYNMYYNNPNVSADLLIAKDYFNRIIISSPNEIKGLLDSLNAKRISPAIGGDVLRSPDILPTGRNFYSFRPKTIPTKEACAIAKQTMDEFFVEYYERNGKFPEKMAFILWGIETMRNHGIPHCQMLYAIGVEPTWDKKRRVIYYSKKKASDLHIMNESEMMLTLTNGTKISRPRIDVIGHSSGLHRDQFPMQMLLLDDAIRLVAELNESDERNYIKKHSEKSKEYYINLINSTHANLTADEIISEAEKLSRSRLFAPPEGDYGVKISDPVSASNTWDDTDKIADRFIERSGNLYIDGELYASPYVSGVDAFKETIKDTDAVVLIRSTHLWGVLNSDDPFQFMGGMSLAIEYVSGERPEMWMTNVRDKDNPRMQTLQEFMNMEKRTQMFNPNYIKGMMEHGYSGARQLTHHIANLWGWDVVDTRFVDENDWNEVYEVYVQDKYDLGLKDWFDENSPWAQQTMMARMLEATRKEYWTPSDEVKTALAEEYQQSVEEFGPCCCKVCCGIEELKTYVQEIISATQPPEEEAPPREPTYYRRGGGGRARVVSEEPISEGVTNETVVSGVGRTGEAIERPPSETGETAEEVKKGKVMKEEKTAPAPPISVAPLLMGLIAVLVIMVFVGIGFWIKRRR